MNERQIGENIRRQRTTEGLTVAALAQKSALTKGALSKIETGRASPPISTLIRIAAGLDTTLASLFIEPVDDPPYVHTPRGKGNTITHDGNRFGYAYEALALTLRNKTIEPFVLTIAPSDPVGRFRHGGQEFIFMLSGQLEMTVGGDKLTLRTGDSLYFDPTLEHTTRAVGKRAARFLCIFMPTPATSTSAAKQTPRRSRT